MKRTAIVLATIFSASLMVGCANWGTSTMGARGSESMAPTGATGTATPSNPGSSSGTGTSGGTGTSR